MKTRYSIRNYNAAVREIRAHTGGTLAEARETWRRLRDATGQPPGRNDVRRARPAVEQHFQRARYVLDRELLSKLNAQIRKARNSDEYMRILSRVPEHLIDLVDMESSEDPIETGRKASR